jgi:hypothetical protein
MEEGRELLKGGKGSFYRELRRSIALEWLPNFRISA